MFSMTWTDFVLKLGDWLRRGAVVIIVTGSMAGSTLTFRDQLQRVRVFTRALEFEFGSWTLDALAIKGGAAGLDWVRYLDEGDRKDLVLGYMDLVREADDYQRSIEQIYGNPDLENPESAAALVRADLLRVQGELGQIGPIAEAVIQEYAAAVLGDLGVRDVGLVLPPVSFHFSTLPKALIVSPREVIRQDASIQLDPAIQFEQEIELEDRVAESLNVSTLVVPIGGIGTYPTMVMRSASINWVVETVIHEWVHNYLSLRPLGLNYSTTPELRTMNETTASILGREIGREVVARFFPEHLPPPPPPPAPEAPPTDEPPPEPPAFDFRAEMRETRVRAEELLAAGKIEEAEAYMENRREVFWEQGYRHIRKLNQAYFAFYGAYADTPGGAAGEDPVGTAVRELWDRLQNPRHFLMRMAWMDSFAELQRELAREQATTG